MPRDTLTSEQIVRAATDLLDEAGLEGLNMRALGQRLGSAATAAYWHVGSKENLITLAGDQIWSELPLPDGETLGWREAVREMANGLYTMLTRHPWLLQAFGSYLIFGPGRARHSDHGLAILETAGFTGEQADQAAAILSSYVLGNALGPAAAAALARKLDREGPRARQRIQDNVARTRTIAEQFPRLRSRLAAADTAKAGNPPGTFEVGLQAILDGLQAQLISPTANRNAPTTPPAATGRPAER